jgi:hypothetical protein
MTKRAKIRLPQRAPPAYDDSLGETGSAAA